MEAVFKEKLMQKFAEDERLEQLTQAKRREREAQHAKDVEELWVQRLEIYQQQREAEIAERAARVEEERQLQALIEEEKARLLAENEAILRQYNPKAMQAYGETRQQRV
jgi:hypothetical protein